VQHISPQNKGTITAVTRETIQPVPSGAAQRQGHSPSISKSELSNIRSAIGVLGSDADLQAVYREMSFPKVTQLWLCDRLTEPIRNFEKSTPLRPLLKAGKQFDRHNPIYK
jgi:hypothetical protein